MKSFFLHSFSSHRLLAFRDSEDAVKHVLIEEARKKKKERSIVAAPEKPKNQKQAAFFPLMILHTIPKGGKKKKQRNEGSKEALWIYSMQSLGRKDSSGALILITKKIQKKSPYLLLNVKAILYV